MTQLTDSLVERYASKPFLGCVTFVGFRPFNVAALDPDGHFNDLRDLLINANANDAFPSLMIRVTIHDPLTRKTAVVFSSKMHTRLALSETSAEHAYLYCAVSLLTWHGATQNYVLTPVRSVH